LTPPPVAIELAPAALADAEESAAFIARDDPSAAGAFLQSVGKLLSAFSLGPEIGPRMLTLDDAEIRAISIPRFRGYRAFYVHDQQRNRLRVLRILHDARDWRSLLAEEHVR